MLLTRVDEWPPRPVVKAPPLAPANQRVVPSTVAALRMLFPLSTSPTAVVVSTFPLPSTRPTTRLTVAEAVLAIPAVPRAAS